MAIRCSEDHQPEPQRRCIQQHASHPRRPVASGIHLGSETLIVGSYTIYDPGRGEDYRLEVDGVDFSSLAANVCVIHGDGVDWRCAALELDALFQSAGGASYVAYRPWGPGLEEKIACLRAVFPGASGKLDQFAVQPLAAPFAATVLDLRESLGDSSSGLWTIGTGQDVATVQAAAWKVDLDDLPFEIALGLSLHGVSTLALDEGGLSILVAPMQPAVHERIVSVTTALAAEGYELSEKPA